MKKVWGNWKVENEVNKKINRNIMANYDLFLKAQIKIGAKSFKGQEVLCLFQNEGPPDASLRRK